jgi:NAD(P)H-dependent FMN reductase
MGVSVVAIVGSYRKEKTIDNAVSAVLEGVEDTGARTIKIYLLDMHIEFCSNCRTCMQEKGGPTKGKCVHNDDMDGILDQIDRADALILAAPINVGNVTAIMKRFVERLAPYAYWPWGEAPAPAPRIKRRRKKAVIITSSACPAFIGKIFYHSSLGLLKTAAKFIGADVTKSLYFGLAAGKENSQPPEKALLRARMIGRKLAQSVQQKWK